MYLHKLEVSITGVYGLGYSGERDRMQHLVKDFLDGRYTPLESPEEVVPPPPKKKCPAGEPLVSNVTYNRIGKG